MIKTKRYLIAEDAYDDKELFSAWLMKQQDRYGVFNVVETTKTLVDDFVCYLIKCEVGC